MRRLFALLVILGSGLSNPAFSASQDQRIRACLEGELSTDEAEQLVVDISEFTYVFSDYVANNAAACFTKLTGKPSEFEKGRGLVVDQDAIEIVRQNRAKLQEEARVAAEEAERREKELLDKAEKAPRIREELKCSLLERRIAILDEQGPYRETLSEFDASIEARKQEAILQTVLECNAWASEDRRSAMTNQVCQEIFFELGLPDSSVDGPSIETVAQARLQVSSFDLELSMLDERLVHIATEEKFVSETSELRLLKHKDELAGLSKEKAEEPLKSDCDLAWERWLKYR